MKTLRYLGRKALQLTVFLWITIVWLFSVLVVIIDRIVMSFAVWRDMPSLREIDEYEYLKDDITRRFVIYLFITVITFILIAIFD